MRGYIDTYLLTIAKRKDIKNYYIKPLTSLKLCSGIS